MTDAAGYSGTPLLQKLGVKEGSRMAIVDGPRGFVDSLPGLPAGANLVEGGTSEADVIVVFVMSRVELRAMDRVMKRMPPGGGMLWVAWPRKSSKIHTDLNENVIREVGLRAGLVDTKVCAIDETWSGLRFSRRRVRESTKLPAR